MAVNEKYMCLIFNNFSKNKHKDLALCYTLKVLTFVLELAQRQKLQTNFVNFIYSVFQENPESHSTMSVQVIQEHTVDNRM